MVNDSDSSINGIRLICAGLGRTGTLSLTDALQTLGYSPYHYVDFRHTKAWASLARGESTADDIIDVIVRDGYDAVVENPSSDIYQDLLRRYPDAKVVLTVRDSPEKFEASWKTLFDTMIVTEQPFTWRFPSFFGWISSFCDLKTIRHFMGTTHLGLQQGDLTHGWRNKPNGWIAEQYKRHNQHVVDHVPDKQLLVFNVKQGWEPLCKFLGCKVPTDEGGNPLPFPHSKVNDTQALNKLRKTFVFAVYSWIPIVATVGGGAVIMGAIVGDRVATRLCAK